MLAEQIGSGNGLNYEVGSYPGMSGSGFNAWRRDVIRVNLLVDLLKPASSHS